jgi:electron transfer flavoprotein alpha/beta subunit
VQIAVCVKVVPDTEGCAIELDAGAIFEINPHDLPALRLALELRAATRGRVSVYSATDRPCEPLLRRVLLAGIDEVHLIRPSSRTAFRRREALRAIGNELGSIKPEVILCGFESIDDMQGAFGPELAHHMGFGFVSEVIGIHGVAGDRLELERMAAPGWAQRIRCAVPVVLSTVAYSPADATRMQLPLAPERVCEAVNVHTWDVDCGGTETDPWENQVTTLELARVRERFVQEPDPSLPAEARIAAIYASRGSREGTNLTGTPEEIADRLVAILDEIRKPPRV